MSEESIRGPFRPTKVIVLSELTTRERELYYQLMVANKAKLFRDEEGRYVANMRILAPHVRKVENEAKKRSDPSCYSLTFQDRLTRLKNEGFIDVIVVAPEHLNYNAYPRFTALIANNGDSVRPRQRPFTWVMKIVEDIYDHRFSLEKNDIEREEESPSFDLMLLIFPVFVVRRVGTNVGLKTIVDQTSWDLVYNVNLYRKDYLELEVFGRFLQEFYDHDDLLFFLYVRSVIAKVLHISFKARWQKKFDGVNGQPKSLWISYKEAAHVARIVFGNDNEGLFRDFMRLITPQMVGEKTAAGDSRRIDITEYLHLSVVGYHQSQSQQNENQEGRMLVPIPGQLVPSAPAPVPAGITYVNMGNNNGQQDGSGRTDEQFYSFDDFQQEQAGQGYGGGAGDGYHHYEFSPEERAYQADYPDYSMDQGPGGDGYGEDPYAGELAEGLDLLSLASSPVGRTPHSAPNNNNANTSNKPPSVFFGSDDIPFERSQQGYLPEQTSHDDLEGLGNQDYGQNDQSGDNEGHEEGDDEEMSAFEALQAERESEFLGQLIEPLQLLPEEYAQYATNDLGDRLRQTVQIFLADKNINDLQTLNETLTNFLSLDALKSDMESFRDEIIEYYLQDGGVGGADGEAEDHQAQAEMEQKGGSGQ